MDTKQLLLSSLDNDIFGEDCAIRWAIDEAQRRREDVTRYLEHAFEHGTDRTGVSRPAKRTRQESSGPTEDSARQGPSTAATVPAETEITSNAESVTGGASSSSGSFAALIRAARAKQHQQQQKVATSFSSSLPNQPTLDDQAPLSTHNNNGVQGSNQPPNNNDNNPQQATQKEEKEEEDESFDVHPLQFTSSSQPSLFPTTSRSTQQPQQQQLFSGQQQQQPDNDQPQQHENDDDEPLLDAPAVITKHPSQMTKEEYMQQFRRAPRRGEIGISADRIAEAESLGYVMSGSRRKEGVRYIDRMQRQLHEREAAKMRLQFLQEEDRRNDSEAMSEFIRLAQASATTKQV